MINRNTLLIFPPYSKSVYGCNPTHAFFFKINSYSTRTGLFFQIRHTDRNVIGTAQSIGNLYDAVTGFKAITALKDNLMKLITVDNLVRPVGQEHHDIFALHPTGTDIDSRIFKTDGGCQKIPVRVLEYLLPCNIKTDNCETLFV